MCIASCEDFLPTFWVYTRHYLFTLFPVQRGEGVLNQGAIVNCFDSCEVDFGRNLDLASFTAVDTPAGIDGGHFDVSVHCHPPFLES